MGLYRARVCNLRTVEYTHLARGCVIVALLALATTALTESVSPGQIAWSPRSSSLLPSVVLRSGYRAWLTNQRRVGHYLRSVLLFGAGKSAPSWWRFSQSTPNSDIR